MATDCRILCGDVSDVLSRLDSGSVHCCVTSPPYFALRDYGTGKWVGGDDPACEHKVRLKPSIATSTLHGGKATVSHQQEGFKQQCPRCGARRVDQQIGLEKSLDEYVAKLVEVFRGVRRVLRDDGTAWVNLGSSYASGDTTANQSRHGQREPSCGTGGKEQSGCQESDLACRHCGGERPGGSRSRRGRTARNGQPHREDALRPCKKARGSGHSANGEAFPDASLHDVQASTTLSSCGNGLAACGRADEASGRRQGLRTSSDDARQFSGNSACTCGTAQSQRPSGRNRSDKGLSCEACGYPGVKGLCGKCWAYSSIASLGFKTKDLLPVPWIVAMALQADGWVLRSDVIWHKPNPMPESVRDRPTKSHEYLFLLAKRPAYYYDADAVREPTIATRPAGNRLGFNRGRLGENSGWALHPCPERSIPACGRNRRSVWTIPTQSFKGAHFATFPERLVEPCVLAGTSAHGVCAACGAPWRRVLSVASGGSIGKSWVDHSQDAEKGNFKIASSDGYQPPETLGWSPTCSCNAAVVPATVLDPFAGACTTGVVCQRLGRRFVGIELSPAYVAMARARLKAARAKDRQRARAA
jgi:DNA modification methylase